MSVRYLLDTHAIVYLANGETRKIGTKARKVIDAAEPGELGICAISIAELGQLIHLDKLQLKGSPAAVLGPTLAALVQVPMSLSCAIRAPALRLPHGDPADRLIVATALDLDIPLITKDGNITDSGLVRVIW